ncbi:fungal-specific transcription factor domain-containing protein [Dipodascopsis tothii]|uniref:fungal-specific transcription factor domain-containing protein n=1 Tax=Dipodascopsis tothii TaxID=44089 RepID=UPI0034D00B75
MTIINTLFDTYTRIFGQFDARTCGIMSMKDGPSENPWRTTLVPLSFHHQSLYEGISAMSLFHAAREQPALKMEAMEHMRRSIRALMVGINTMPADVALATTVTLAMCEVWDREITSGIAHLRGAKVLIRQLLASFRNPARPRPESDLRRFKMLFNTWQYLNVLSKLTCETDDDDDPLDAVFDDEVDPLMGCAQALFPLIGAVADLIRKVRAAGGRASSEDLARAEFLRDAIVAWEPPLNLRLETSEDPQYDTDSCVATAEAYQHSILLYLHICLPTLLFAPTSPQSTAELAQRVLDLLMSVPLSSRTVVVHLFPLLSAGCEFDGAVEREVVRDRWHALEKRLQLGNVSRAFDVVEEVWRRRRFGGNLGPQGYSSWSWVMKEWRWQVLVG